MTCVGHRHSRLNKLCGHRHSRLNKLSGHRPPRLCGRASARLLPTTTYYLPTTNHHLPPVLPVTLQRALLPLKANPAQGIVTSSIASHSSRSAALCRKITCPSFSLWEWPSPFPRSRWFYSSWCARRTPTKPSSCPTSAASPRWTTPAAATPCVSTLWLFSLSSSTWKPSSCCPG